MKIGDTVTWKSQAAGSWKEKTGKVIAIVEPEQRLGYFIPKGVGSGRIKAQFRSQLRRVLVEVPRGGKSKLTDFYAPRVGQVNLVVGTNDSDTTESAQ